MELQPMDQVIQNAIKKKGYLQQSISKYLIRAALSGIYIGFGIILSFRLGEGFYDIHSPVASIMTSIFFGIALVLIIYGGSELFTGNTMTFTMSTLKKATTFKDLIENWIACYFGNLMGAVFFALIILFSGILSTPENSQLIMATASGKMHYSVIELFFRAILCNWVVCLAVWLPMHVKGDAAKISVMMLLVFAFVASGFEHSVANMVTFSIALMVPHPETISLMGAIHNLIPVTIGNIIGGGLFVGGVYVFLTSSVKQKKAVEKHASKMNNETNPIYLKKIKV
ncbi:formate/nitrite transporter family protein [Neobacillus sp. K501]